MTARYAVNTGFPALHRYMHGGGWTLMEAVEMVVSTLWVGHAMLPKARGEKVVMLTRKHLILRKILTKG